MRPLVSAFLLVAVALTASAAAGPLDGFRAEIDSRLEDPGLRRGQRRALLRAQTLLARGGLLAEQTRSASQSVRRLRIPFRRDETMAAAEASLVADVTSALTADRDVLDSRRGTLGDDDREAQLAEGIGRADAHLATVASAPGPLGALRRLHLAARDLRAASPPQPDFAIPDVNPASATYDARVSPRSYAERFSAWYFGRAT